MAATTKDPKASDTVQELSINAEELREAIKLEHTITFKEAVSLYRKAIGWSFYFSLGVIMLGKMERPPET
jgi:SP family general alpha glucoside:H+ symporter-like MFS transporter